MTSPFVSTAGDVTLRQRRRLSLIFKLGCRMCTWGTLLVLAVLLLSIIWNAVGWLDWQFLTSYHSSNPQKAGLLAGIWGSFWLILICMSFCIPLGVGTAVYLEEYASDGWLTRIIKVNLANLAGVPSIVYGMLGYAAFSRFFGVMPPDGVRVNLLGLVTIPLPFGPSVLAGSLTMALLVLPVVVIATQEALKAVPPSIRQASFALGATRWQTVRRQVLPVAVPGIVTGVILSVSRAIGETAPLVMIGAMTAIFFSPGGIESPAQLVTEPGRLANVPFDSFTAMPLQIYNWIGEAKREFANVAAAGIVVLLAVLLFCNSAAVFIRHRASKKIRW